ncbi:MULTISPECIES: DJ-1/PfpI family protein [unclassified Colwellia]|uniref:DJ-1/PfpI family protein n=1 Tax=unclassified Colwellia TaxID=196834 RepID=UPI0015F58A56|nr:MULTISPECIES: DJ-1/PfpI family protein [unclassified Colwellia]MBA6257661.1 DJ-1/PfpI family protein [Colwellia sp. MB3u-28]MBA6259418.1 DJ-1/PfpI family protein [Colwellia sp. MB3u-41]MBA6304379.1 DJ-1/PfpI family protein [Colwellia sp. MB02u-14]
MNIGIYIYDNAEVLDFSGPFEVFTTASRVCEGSEPFNVFLISQSGDTVLARAGYKVIPDYSFHNHPEIDVLIVVGGNHSDEINKTDVLSWIYSQSIKSSIVASVCTGAFLLAQAKVLKTDKVTTHWEDITDLRQMFPKLDVVEDVRWVDEGRLITSGGISAGIEMSLQLVNKLHSKTLAEKTAKQMDFLWGVVD